jgi:hypothetical protein
MTPRLPRGVAVAVALAIPAIVPTVASAGVPSPSERADAKRFARNYWQRDRGRFLRNPSCYERVQVRIGRDDPNVLGWVTSPYSCTIWLNRNADWTDAGQRDTWWQVCATTIHEWGHLVGRRHSSNPNSIMAASVDQNWSASWWPWFADCRYDGDDTDGDGTPDR